MELRDEALELIIKRAAVVFKKDEADLSEDTHFVNDLQAKSANYVLITTFLEDEFDVEVPFMEFKRNKTVGQAADFIVQLVEG